MTEYLAWKKSTEYFGTIDAESERYHRPWAADAPYDLIETSWFGFCIPEEGLNCEIYHWAHPVLGVASGGIFLFKGRSTDIRDVEFMDYRNFMPIPDDMTDCTYANGVTVRMIEPLTAFAISYRDPAGSVVLDLETRAIMPVAMRPNGGHFTQAMRNSGRLTLHGREYAIGSYFSRDRSWRDPRTEQRINMPPAGWYAGVFGDDFAFNITAFDSDIHNPGLAERYPAIGGSGNFIWGYVWKDGTLLGVRHCEKVTRYDADGRTPLAVEMRIIDERDEVYAITGEIVSQYPMAPWPNLRFQYGLARWQCGNRIGWGEAQEAVYDDYLRTLRKG